MSRMILRLEEFLMMSIGSVKSAGSAGNYYTDKDNYYVIGSMEERWQGKGRKRWVWTEKQSTRPCSPNY